MSRWRNVNPASFKKKSNAIGDFAQGFASVWVPATMKQVELDEKRKYEEEQEKKKRAAAAAKAAAEADRKEKKLAKNARILASQFAENPNNPEVVAYFHSQLQLMDGDVGDVMALTTKAIDDGRLSFPTIVQDQPVQGPDVPRDFPLTVNPDNRVPITEFKGGKAITAGNVDTFKSIQENGRETNPYKTEGDQMAEIFAPVSEEPVLQKRTSAVEITPYGQQSDKLDFGRLTDLDSIESYKLEIDSGNVKLSETDLGIIESRIKQLQGQQFEDTLLEAAKSKDHAEGVLKTMEVSGEQGTDNYNKLKSIVDWHQGKVEKPYAGLISPETVAGAEDANELRTNLRIARMLGATNEELAPLNNEIVIRSQQEEEAASQVSVEDTIDLASMDKKELTRVQAVLAKDTRPEAVAKHAVVSTLLAVEEDVNLADYLTGMGSVNATKERITQVKNDSSIPADVKKEVLDVMEKHLEEIEKDAVDLKLTDQEYFGEITVKGKPVRVDLILTEKGEFFSPTLQKTFSREEVANPQSLDNYKTMMGNATRLQDNVFAKVIDTRTNVEDLLIRAKSLDDIVRTSDASVLTFIGGKASSIIQRIENEVGALDAYFRGNSEEDIRATITRIVSADAQDKNTQDAMEKVGINADLYARYQSQLIEFAFVYARTGLGQDRTTDQDFKAAMNVVAAGSSYPTFTKSLRDLVKKSYDINQTEHDKYLTRPDVLIAVDQPGADKYYSGFLIDMNEYMSSQENMQTSIGWMNQTVTVPESTEPPEAVVKPKTIGEAVSAYKGEASFVNDAKTFANLPSDALKEQWVDLIAEKKNLPPQVIRDALSSYKGQ